MVPDNTNTASDSGVSEYKRSAPWNTGEDFPQSVFGCFIFCEIFLKCRNFCLEFSNLFSPPAFSAAMQIQAKHAVDGVHLLNSSFQSEQHDTNKFMLLQSYLYAYSLHTGCVQEKF